MTHRYEEVNEGPREGGFALKGLSRSNLKADEICPTGKAFDVELTDDHDDISVQDIGDDEQDSECVWGDGPSIRF